METIKGRKLEQGQEVFVYFNLHKKCFSVKDVKTGLVVAHVDTVTLLNVTFKVSQSGRERVLKEQRKNVHAGVKGFLHATTADTNGLAEAYYNPNKVEQFVNKETGEPLERAMYAVLSDGKCYYTKGW